MAPSLTELRKLRVVDLRERLQQLGLTTSGLKNDLVERLHKYYQDQEQLSQGQPDPQESVIVSGIRQEDVPGIPQQHGLLQQQQQMLFQQQMMQQQQLLAEQQRQQQMKEQQHILEQQQQQQQLFEEQQRRHLEQLRAQQLEEQQQQALADQAHQQQLLEQQRQQQLEQQMLEQQKMEQLRQEEQKRQQQLAEQQQLLEQRRLLELEQQRQLEHQQLLERQRREQEEEERQLILEQQREKERQHQQHLEEQERHRLIMEEQLRQRQIQAMEEQRQQQKLLEEERQKAIIEEHHRLLQQQQQQELEEQQRQQRLIEEQRLREEQRLLEEQHQQQLIVEQQRLLEEQRQREEEERQQQLIMEQQRLLEEQQHQQRMQEQRRQQEEAMLQMEEEKRRQEEAMQEQLRMEEQRHLEEQQRLLEEQQQQQIQAEQQEAAALQEERNRAQQAEIEAKQLAAAAEIAAKEQEAEERIIEQQQELIEKEKQRLLQQQQERIRQRQEEKQRQDEETRQKVLQQQQMLEEQQRAEQHQQQMLLEKQKQEAEEAEQAELLRQQQIAMELQRQEDEKIQQQREMLRQQEREEREKEERQRESNRAPLLPTPGMGQGELSTRGNRPFMQGPSGVSGPPGVSDRDFDSPIHASQDNDSDEDEESLKNVELPQALEKVLAFKNFRAQELGVNDEEDPTALGDQDAEPGEPGVEDQEYEREEDEDEGFEEVSSEGPQQARKLTKNQRRKKKKKRRKAAKKIEQLVHAQEGQDNSPGDSDLGVEVEYVPEQVDMSDPSVRQFSRIFEAFKLSEPAKPEQAAKDTKMEKTPEKKKEEPKKKTSDDEDSDSDSDNEKEKDDDGPKMSKKKLRKMNRLSVAELKQLVHRPDVVEMHDVTARDPKLLVYLKAYRNTVPVPRHWCFKRKYLQGKRGIEKPAFELPEFIMKTGIMEMRQALQEKEEQQTMKTKMRQKVRPKMGKIDIDYQKLHDAFFKWQTKPKMTIHGDLYYEGKEFETRLKEKKPGELSDDLKTALGMPVGPNSQKYPPPWLIAMQRYGPPPSYPNLKISGLNAPIPENCSFGYHAGGWGKPPVDETGKPLYGDVFGTNSGDFKEDEEEEEIDHTRWGELESESEESSSEEESEEEDEEGEVDETGLITPADGGLITPSGLTSIPTGMETPEMIELRKKKIEDAMDQGGETPSLYTIIPEKRTAVGGAMMGSSHVYDTAAAKKVSGTGEGVAITLDPSELDLDTAAMAAKYEQQVREQQSQLEKEDFSDMVAEHAAKQKNKRKKQSQDSGKAAKKYKEFKF